VSKTVLKRISMTLDPQSIEKAIQEVEQFKTTLENICVELVKKLIEDGVNVARIFVTSMGAVDTGELADSFQAVYFPEEHCGVVFTDCPHALYVEFGTGIVGAQAEEGDAHPLAEKLGWDYDVNQHGEAGWWYPAPFGWYVPKDGDGKALAWTKGMQPRPYMYKTFQALKEMAKTRIVEVLNSTNGG